MIKNLGTVMICVPGCKPGPMTLFLKDGDLVLESRLATYSLKNLSVFYRKQVLKQLFALGYLSEEQRKQA